jgi:hypothetical protein
MAVRPGENAGRALRYVTGSMGELTPSGSSDQFISFDVEDRSHEVPEVDDARLHEGVDDSLEAARVVEVNCIVAIRVRRSPGSSS